MAKVASTGGWLGALGFGSRPRIEAPDPTRMLNEVALTGELPKDQRAFASAVTAVCLEIAPIQGISHRDSRPFSQAKIGEFDIFIRRDATTNYSVMVRHEGNLVFGSSPGVVHQAVAGAWCKDLLDLRPVAVL